MQVDWEIVSGEGTITSVYGASICFIAPPTATTTIIKATGSLCHEEIVFDVIEPNDVRLTAFEYKHHQGIAGSGFCASIQVLPTSVSFMSIQVREGAVDAFATGSFASFNGLPHAVGIPISIGPENRAYGASDTVYTPAGDPNPNPNGYTPGVFLWAIPWEFKCGSAQWKEFAVIEHQAGIDASGKVTTIKGGAWSEHQVSDPDEDCP